MIFEQLFDDNFSTTFFFSRLIGQKQYIKIEREHNMNMRDKVVKTLSQNGYTNIIS